MINEHVYIVLVSDKLSDSVEVEGVYLDLDLAKDRVHDLNDSSLNITAFISEHEVQ